MLALRQNEAERIEDRRAALNLLLARTGAAVAWYAAPEAVAYSDHVPWLATLHEPFVAAPEPMTPA